MKNQTIDQFEKWNVKVPEYVKVRINNGEKPLIDFCNDVVKKFEELENGSMREEMERFVHKMKVIIENSKCGAFSENSLAKEVTREKEETV